MVVKFGVIMMFVLMVLHLIIFKHEISKALNIIDFKIPTKDDILALTKFGEDFAKIFANMAATRINKIKNKIDTYKLNPIGLVMSTYSWVDDEVAKELPDAGWGEFIQNNVLSLIITGGIMSIILGTVSSIISGLVTGSLLALIVSLPYIIGVFLSLSLLVMVVGIFMELFISDNTLEVIQCAEGLDASGNRRDPASMQDYEKSQMKMCKYWMDMTEPHTIIFPTIWGKKNNIKVTQVLKDQTGQIIKVILPGNVKYDVIIVEVLPSEDPVDFKESGNRKIYISASGIDTLKKNVIIFKDLKNEIYEPDKIFKAFEKDYKDNIMNYYGPNNIYYLFLHPFLITMIVVVIMLLRGVMTLPPNSSEGISVFVKEKSMMISIIILILKIMVAWGPIKHILGIIGHLDYITVNSLRNQALLLLFEVLTYFSSGGLILLGALTNNTDIINKFSMIGSGGGIVLLLISSAITILVGDIINCEIEGKNKCKPIFYTEIERIKTCNELKKKYDNEEFTNFSNNHIKNLGYTKIKEQFTANNIINDFKCDKRILSWQASISTTIEEYFISFAKIIAYQGKLKDYLDVKKIWYYFLIMGILILVITKGLVKISTETVTFNPISFIIEMKVMLYWFFLCYIFLSVKTSSYALSERKSILNVAIGTLSDIFAGIGGSMLLLA